MNDDIMKDDDNLYARLYVQKYPHGERLDKIKRLIKLDLFRPVLNGLFKDTKVGRPHVDVVVMTKMLVLQSWYSLSAIEQLDDYEGWKKKHGYGMRWMVEAAFSAFKRTFGEHVLAKSMQNMIRELIIKANLYNLFMSMKP